MCEAIKDFASQPPMPVAAVLCAAATMANERLGAPCMRLSGRESTADDDDDDDDDSSQ